MLVLTYLLNSGQIEVIYYLRKVSAPLDARRLGFVLDAEMLLCTPRCVGLCTDEVPPPPLPVAVSLPAIFRRESDEPDREPSDSGCLKISRR